MTVKRAPRFQRLLAKLAGGPRRAEPSCEHIRKVELRTLLERDCYEEAVFRLETSPGHMDQLLELLRERDVELPGVAILFRLAKAGNDISNAVGALSVRLLCDDLNISAYSARALAHHHLRRGELDELDLLLSSGVSSVQYGCAEGLRDACLENNTLAIGFALGALYKSTPDALENILWALRTAGELGSDDVRKTLVEMLSEHMGQLKGSGPVRLDVYRHLSEIHKIASREKE